MVPNVKFKWGCKTWKAGDVSTYGQTSALYLILAENFPLIKCLLLRMSTASQKEPWQQQFMKYFDCVM